jgi:hypothetical protein
MNLFKTFFFNLAPFKINVVIRENGKYILGRLGNDDTWKHGGRMERTETTLCGSNINHTTPGSCRQTAGIMTHSILALAEHQIKKEG